MLIEHVYTKAETSSSTLLQFLSERYNAEPMLAAIEAAEETSDD